MATITAKTPFAHGSLDLKKGDTATVSAATARELHRAGLIEGPEDDEDEGEADQPQAATAAPADARKMSEPALNKRAADPANKSGPVTTATAPRK